MLNNFFLEIVLYFFYGKNVYKNLRQYSSYTHIACFVCLMYLIFRVL